MTSPHVIAVRSMVAALNNACEALVTARLDELLAAERQLSAAVGLWPHGQPASPSDLTELRNETRRLRAALTRCRRLGLVLQGLGSGALQACARCSGYGPTGVSRLIASPQPVVEARA